MHRKRIIRIVVWSSLLLAVMMNVLAYFHAYSFTHYYDLDSHPTEEELKQHIVSSVLTGVQYPRPPWSPPPIRSMISFQLNDEHKTDCWFWPQPSEFIEHPTVLILHGYHESKAGMVDKASIFFELGFNVLMIDFMGVGGSKGNVTTIGYKEAAQVDHAVDYLMKQGNRRVVIFGTSMGAAAAMRAVAEYGTNVDALILECPFSSLLRTVENRFEIVGLPTFPMAHVLTFWGGAQHGFWAFNHSPQRYASSIQAPTLMLYGLQDPKVHMDEIQGMTDSLKGPTQLVLFPEAGHDNYLDQYEEEWKESVVDFLRTETDLLNTPTDLE